MPLLNNKTTSKKAESLLEKENDQTAYNFYEMGKSVGYNNGLKTGILIGCIGIIIVMITFMLK
jgi:tetrahydromethanopterin S-methyltransferase subunit G